MPDLIRSLFLGLSLLAAGGTVQAQVRDSLTLPVADSVGAIDSSLLPMLTVEAAVSEALNNNFDIRLARNDSAVAAIDFAYRNAAFLPSVNANGTYLLNNNAQQQTLADGTKRNRSGIRSNNLNSSIGLNWVVFDGFRMFIARDRVGQLLEQGGLVVRTQIVNTVAEVVRTYYDIVRQKQQLRAVEEQMVLNEERYRLAKYRLDIGVGVKPDVLQAQIDLNAQRAARLTQINSIEALKQTLNLLMNVPATATYDVSDTIPVRTDLRLADFTNLQNTSPALQLAQGNIDLAALAVRERRAERLPTVGLTSAYSFNRTENGAVINPFQPLFNLNRGFNYGVTASIPIFNGFNTRRLIRQAENEVRFQELNYESQVASANTALNTAFRSYQLQKQAVTLEEENIALVRENLFIARERYRLAATPFLELREAQQSLAEAYTRLINARFNLKVAETEMLRIQGTLINPL